jgi:hypothetical protein
MRLLQMHHLAGLLPRLLRLIEPGNPLLHIGTTLEQISALLPAIFAAVRRQNILDIRFGNLREYLAHLV